MSDSGSTDARLRVLRRADLLGTARHVRNANYETVRFLLAGDGVGVTVTDITLAPDVEAVYGYDAHVEIAYCIEGRATIRDLADGSTHAIEPGTLWIAPRGSRFVFIAAEATRLICVFSPAFAGDETGYAGDQ